MRKFLLERMTRPVLYIPTMFRDSSRNRLYIPLDGIAIMMGIGFFSSVILSFFVSIGWAIPFVTCIFLFIIMSVYFKLYPRQWHEMNDYEKLAYVDFNGVSSLSEEQIKEYYQAILNIYNEDSN